jgi:predicted ribosomally synthesized peptide with nif11-like leader
VSQDQIAAIKDRLASDPAFAAEIQGAKSREDAVRIAKAHGFDVSVSTKLSEEELDSVAGGCALNAQTQSY